MPFLLAILRLLEGTGLLGSEWIGRVVQVASSREPRLLIAIEDENVAGFQRFEKAVFSCKMQR